MITIVAQAHVHVCCLTSSHCIHYVHIFLCAVCLHVSVHKWFFHVASNVVAWPCCLSGHYRIWSLSVLLDHLHLKVLSLQLTQKICRFRLSVGPSPQPCCGFLTQHGMCYSSHVVMSCQKRPWQMLLFCLWNVHVGLTLQTIKIIHNWLPCTCKICFVGMQCHNSKAGRRFIYKVNEIQHSSLQKSWENNRKDISIINGQTCGFITEQHTFLPYSKWPLRTYSMKQSMLVTAQYNYCIYLTPPNPLLHCS